MMNHTYQGKLGQYQLIETEDKSLTLQSDYFSEACHSLSGAYSETVHNYINHALIPYLDHKPSTLTILEVGFGLGVGYQATCAYLKDHYPTLPLHFITLELDPALVEFASKHTSLPENTDYPLWTELEQTSWGFCAQKSLHRLNVLIGDARQTLKPFLEGLKAPIDIIYHDPFSPKKNPALWTLEWMQLLHAHGHQNSVMSTYCASQSARKTMMLAGFAVKSFKGFGQKKQGSQVLWSGKTDPEILPLGESPKVPVLYDHDLPTF